MIRIMLRNTIMLFEDFPNFSLSLGIFVVVGGLKVSGCW